MQTSYDANLVVLSGLPMVAQQSQRVLSKFILRKLLEHNPDDHSKIYVPVDGLGNSLGLAIVRYPSSDDATTGIETYNGTIIDRGHTMVVERLDASQAFGAAVSQGDIDHHRIQGVAEITLVNDG